MANKIKKPSDLAEYGIRVERYKEFRLSDDEVKVALDAEYQLQTTANSGIPAELTTIISSEIVPILQAKRGANEIFSERLFGNRTTSIFKVIVSEFTGTIAPYDDFSASGKAGNNYNFPARENFLFQTVATWGDLEEMTMGLAKVNLATQKQEAAAHILAVAHNRIWLYGVEGLKNYGILNDPSLNSPIAAPTNAKSNTLWADSNAQEIYKSILGMFAELQTVSGANVDQRTPLRLVVSPESNALLATVTDLGKSVLEMLKAYFSSIEIVVVPEYDTASGNLVSLIAPDVLGQPTGQCIFSEKLNAGRIVPGLSNFAQKFTGGSFGAAIYRPLAIVRMLGV